MHRERVRLPGASSAEDDGARVDSIHEFLATSIEEKHIWAGLYESVHDALFPAKLPPLELTSSPIATPDRMAARTNPWAIGTAAIANGCILAILILVGLGTARKHFDPTTADRPFYISDFPVLAPHDARAARGGPGGGNNELIDPATGRPPRLDNMPLAPPQVPVIDNPMLAVDPAIPIDLKLPDNSALLNIGVHSSPSVTLASNGPGMKAGIGSGSDGGVGPGKGPGYGTINGPGDSIYQAGVGGVTNPVPITSPEAEFSDEARRQKYQGVCMISVIVDAQGYPQNPRVIQRLGMGLDEKALEAVAKYRFKPAMKDGRPVPVLITVMVNFRLY
jgi:protein TonB